MSPVGTGWGSFPPPRSALDGGTFPSGLNGGNPPVRRQNSYAAGGMPLEFTQEDFLVCYVLLTFQVSHSAWMRIVSREERVVAELPEAVSSPAVRAVLAKDLGRLPEPRRQVVSHDQRAVSRAEYLRRHLTEAKIFCNF